MPVYRVLVEARAYIEIEAENELDASQEALVEAQSVRTDPAWSVIHVEEK